ncbi:MAG: hypothetical protein JWM47_2138 [Acidimicrobiales bacterium]|nr:hypothetical protein [Acidimicrobiales bacterium]
MPFFKDIFKFLSFDGPVHWDMARQLAVMGATGGTSEPNTDPLQRIRLEELLRVAELRVADATGLPTTVTGRLLTVRPVTKAEWALKALEDWKELLEGLAVSLGQAPSGPSSGGDADLGAGAGAAGGSEPDVTGFLGDLTAVMGPMLMSVQIGGMTGHLAQRAMGQYEPPLPRPPSDELLVVASTVEQFASEWSLPADDVRLWVLLHEITWHAVLGRPHVRRRLQDLLREYVTGFHPNPMALEERLGDLDPTNLTDLPAALGDPEALLGAVQTDEQRAVLARIDALVTPMAGYVDHVLDSVGRTLIGSYGPLHEALRRRQLEEDDATRFLGRLLGLELGQSQYERGGAFVRGVLERSGAEGLARLWESEPNLPTPAEIGAPGLWLARIDLPAES